MIFFSRAKALLACMLTVTLLHPAAVCGTNVALSWSQSSSPLAVGYILYYGLESGIYMSSTNVGQSLTATVNGLVPGLTYYFAAVTYDAIGDESVFSNVVTNRVPVPPSIIDEPLTQTAIVGTPASLAVTAAGDAPLSFQWLNGGMPIRGATNPVFGWLQIENSNAGNYSVTVTNSWGSIVSSVATLSIVTAPTILVQPQSQTVIATTPASFSSGTTGTAPLAIQWYSGATAVAGATNSTLAWANVPANAAGTYYYKVSNAGASVTSSVATLTILPTNTISAAAGIYNGLFYQTNANGTPSVTEASGGFFGNCVVASNGVFSAKVYVGGMSYPIAGNFNISGNASMTISSNLSAILHLDLIDGTHQLTGTISGTASTNTWTASLLAEPATNLFPQLSGVNLVLSPGRSAINFPTNNGVVVGGTANGVLLLSGLLGDTTPFSQSVPIALGGTVPLYASLYNNTGLVEGWINLANGGVSGSLNWVRPSGVLLPSGFPQGFDTTLQVTGTMASVRTYMASFTPSTLRNNYSGSVGLSFTPSVNMHIVSLGRFVVPGNSQSHTLTLYPHFSCTTLGSATIATSNSASGTFAYGAITPVSVTAGTRYDIVSDETSGGDQWYDQTTYMISNASDATAYVSIYGSACPWNANATGKAYAPVNFQYTVP